jgi:hypothetical protein
VGREKEAYLRTFRLTECGVLIASPIALVSRRAWSLQLDFPRSPYASHGPSLSNQKTHSESCSAPDIQLHSTQDSIMGIFLEDPSIPLQRCPDLEIRSDTPKG